MELGQKISFIQGIVFLVDFFSGSKCLTQSFIMFESFVTYISDDYQTILLKFKPRIMLLYNKHLVNVTTTFYSHLPSVNSRSWLDAIHKADLATHL